MKIHTCYRAAIRCHYIAVKQKGNIQFTGTTKVDSYLMKQTADICLDALKFFVDVVLKEWDVLSNIKGILRKNRFIETMIHSTKNNKAKYTQFDIEFQNMPSYVRRAIVADAIGKVSSYKSNLKNWEALPNSERKKKPDLGLSEHYQLTFYKGEYNTSELDKGIIGLKLYNGKTWDWYYFHMKPSDARYIYKVSQQRKLLSPIVEQRSNGYFIRFCFEETKELVPNKPLNHRILAVDLGINAPASWCVMESDGSVLAKGVVHLPSDEGYLNHVINKKRMYQQAGKKSKCVYRWIKQANEALSIATTKAIMEVAILYNVDCIVFEYLERPKKQKGSHKYKERIHMWRANDVQSRVELRAHRLGMRISRICAKNTSKYAFDGSGFVERDSKNYSICKFSNGKVYNCDLSAAQNIGARYFLRAYRKEGIQNIPVVPQCTLNTLKTTVTKSSGLTAA